jgi:hypothetical protein
VKPVTVAMFRAYLTTASLASVVIIAVALFAISVLGVPDKTFETPAFRIVVFAVTVCTVLLTKLIAGIAFHVAVSHRYVTSVGTTGRSICVADRCPGRHLVILHLRFSGRLSDLVDS